MKLTVTDSRGQHHTARKVIYVKEGGTCWQKLSRRNKITLAKVSLVIGTVSTLFTILAKTTDIFEGDNNATTKAVGDSCKRKEQCASKICWNMTCGCASKTHFNDDSQFCFRTVGRVSQCSESEAFAPLFEATLLNTQDVMATPQGDMSSAICSDLIQKVVDCYNAYIDGENCEGLNFRRLGRVLKKHHGESCNEWAEAVCGVINPDTGGCAMHCLDELSDAVVCGARERFNHTHQCDLRGMCSSGVFTHAPTLAPSPRPTPMPTPMPSPEPTTNKPSAQPSLDPTPAPEMCNGKEFVRGEEFCWINGKKESTLDCSEYFTKKEGSEKKRYEEKCREDKEPDDNGRFVLGAMDCPVCIRGLPSKAPTTSLPSSKPSHRPTYLEPTQSPSSPEPTPAPTEYNNSTKAILCGDQVIVPRISFCKLKNENGIEVFKNCSFFKHEDEEKKKSRRSKHCTKLNPGSLE